MNHSSFRRTLSGTPFLWMVGPLLCGCGLPPCYEGRLAVELGPVVEGYGTCAFQDWPGDDNFEVDTTGNGDFLRNICITQLAEFVYPPANALVGGVLSNTGGPNMGLTFTSLEHLTFVLEGCTLTAGLDLRIDEQLYDVDAAFQAQAAGEDAFYVRIGYNGNGTCDEYFPDTEPDRTAGCMNFHQARITKR